MYRNARRRTNSSPSLIRNFAGGWSKCPEHERRPTAGAGVRRAYEPSEKEEYPLEIDSSRVSALELEVHVLE